MGMENKNHTKFKSLRTILWILVFLALGFILYQTNLRVRHSINGNPLQSYQKGSFAALEVLPNPPSIDAHKFFDKNGKEITLSQIQGKIKVVNIWATWCPPCVREMPELAQFAQNHKSKGVIVIPISIDKPEEKEKVQKKLNELSGGRLEFYQDPKMELPFALAVKGFPTTIIYDENNKEIARIPSTPKWDGDEANGLVDLLLLQSKNIDK